MCGGGSSKAAEQSQAAEERARREAAEREARIHQGQGNIDRAFGQYDDAYYGKYAKSIEGYQRPQLDEQYGDATGKMTAALADRGMLESTHGAQETGKLGRIYLDTVARINSESKDAAKDLRARVENQKGDLYALNRASADPSGINAQAIGQATALAAPGAVSPLGAIFEGALLPYLTYQTAKRNSAGQPYRSSAPVATGSGTARNIGG